MKSRKSFSQAREMRNTKKVGAWEVGGAYLVRTVAHEFKGVLRKVFKQELVFSEAPWLTGSGRLMDLIGVRADAQDLKAEEWTVGRGQICFAEILDGSRY